MLPYLYVSEDDDENRKKGTEEKFESLFMAKMLKERIIFMSDEVTSSTAKKVINQLLVLDAMGKKKPIYLFINSPGGEIYSGMAVFDMINFIDSEVVTIASGLTASMGTVLLLSGAKGKRFATPHARLMIHQPWGGIRGKAADIDIQAQEILRLKALILAMLVEKTGQSREKIEKDINRNFWMSADEAREYGLIDHVVSSRRELSEILGIEPESEEESQDGENEGGTESDD